MNSTGIRASIAGALLAASANAMPADAADYQANYGHNVITLAQAQNCAPCPQTPHVVQWAGDPQPKTDVDFLSTLLAPAFDKAGKNVLILLSDKPVSENKKFVSELMALAQRYYHEKGVKIHYVMQVYTASKAPQSQSLEGTVRLYTGGFPMDKKPGTGQLMRSIGDVEHALKVAAPDLKGDRKMSGAKTDDKGSSTASSGIQPPDLSS